MEVPGRLGHSEGQVHPVEYGSAAAGIDGEFWVCQYGQEVLELLDRSSADLGCDRGVERFLNGA